VLGRVLAVQEKLISAGGMGIVDPQKIYNTLEKYLENAGYKDASQFFNNPQSMPPRPKGQKRPDPTLALAQQELLRQQAKDQAELQLKARKQQTDEQIQREKINLDQQKLATEILKTEEGNQIQKEKLASQILKEGIN